MLQSPGLVGLALQTPGAHTVHMIGDPGVGKTAVLEQIARRMAASLYVLPAPELAPTDLILPVRLKSGRMDWQPVGTLASAIRRARKDPNHRVVVFIDEASHAPRSMQAALQRIIHERVAGSIKIPANVSFAMASNPPESATDFQGFGMAFSNRCCWLLWTSPTNEEWVGFESGTPTFGTVLPSLDMEQWQKARARELAFFAGFLRKFPALAKEDPAKVKGRFPLAYHTPRSRSFALNLAATATTVGDSDAYLQFVAGCIGEPIAAQIAVYRRETDIPDPEELLAGKEWKPDKSRPDITLATLLGVAEAASDKKHPKFKERFIRAWELLEPVHAANKDLCIVAAIRLARCDSSTGIITARKIHNIILDLRPIIQAAGIITE